MLIDGKEWKLVPVEPTEEMLLAGMQAGAYNMTGPGLRQRYRAMIEAAPTPEATMAQTGAQASPGVPDAHSLYLELSGIDEDLKHGGVGAFDQTCWDTLRRAIHALGVVPPEATQAAQDALDAARYRLLRDFPATYLPEGDLRVWMANRPFDMNGPRGLDALCDAGMAAGGENG